MNILTSLFKKEEIKNKIRTTISRFPVASCISLVVTIIFFSLIAGDFNNEVSEMLGRLVLSLIVTFFLSVGVTLYSESKKELQSYTYLGYIASLLFGGVFYYFLSSDIDNIESVVFFILTLFGVVSLLFSAPYLKHIFSGEYKENGYYVYFYKISTLLFMSLIVGGVLSLGGSLAILAVHVLFDTGYGFSDDLYGYWITLSLTLFTPFFALSEIPQKEDFENGHFNENVFFNFLMRYIAIPFIYVYFFILYAYTIKVLLNFSDWPKGEVSWMVIGFSLFGYATYMFSYIFETKKDTKSNVLIHLFRKYFPYIVIPQIAMLFYAIFLRIGQYDITINRYFVVVFGLWLLTTSLYLIISRVKSLLFIPTFLTLFTLIISIGPWSVYHLPLIRQTARLENNLVQAGILSEGKIVALENYTDINKDLSSQIYDGIDYICDFDNCNSVKEMFPNIYKTLLEQEKVDFEKRQGNYSYSDDNAEFRDPTSWKIVSHVTNAIKVERTYSYGNSDSKIYRFYNSSNIYPLEVSGYDYVLDVNSYNTNDNEDYVKIDIKKSIMSISLGANVEELSTDEILNTLRKKHTQTNNNLSKEERSFEIQSDSYEGMFLLQSAAIPANADTNIEEIEGRLYLDGIIILKRK